MQRAESISTAIESTAVCFTWDFRPAGLGAPGVFGAFGVLGAAPFFASAGASSASSRQERAARIVTKGLPKGWGGCISYQVSRLIFALRALRDHGCRLVEKIMSDCRAI